MNKSASLLDKVSDIQTIVPEIQNHHDDKIDNTYSEQLNNVLSVVSKLQESHNSNDKIYNNLYKIN
ncbi:MAG: hypothetical protein U9Q15_03845 [Patescibacteria group bacterium]|nr:hypothetical protein [Patescibacteria group bacterium]